MDSHSDMLQLFEEKKYLNVCAPMVRYSKLQFRSLVRRYNCDLCYTPMILADSFCQSSKARYNEFTTNLGDVPVIAQFAASTVHDFVGAAVLASPYCSGVDLNCGCPQRWAKQQGLGCALLEEPDKIADLVQQCRNQIAKPFAVSVKMRILKDSRKTVEICKRLENAGVSFLAIHGRPPSQLTGSVNTETLKLAVENVMCPVITNGDVKSVDDALKLHEETKCKGVMVANGLLSNPTLFTGSNVTTLECIQNWLNICYNSTLDLNTYSALVKRNTSDVIETIPDRPPNLTFQCFHHHLVFMLEKVLIRQKRQIFNNLQTFSAVLKFLNEELNLKPLLYSVAEFSRNCLYALDYDERCELYVNLKERYLYREANNDMFYNFEENDGNFFMNKVKTVEPECDIASMFIEDG